MAKQNCNFFFLLRGLYLRYKNVSAIIQPASHIPACFNCLKRQYIILYPINLLISDNLFTFVPMIRKNGFNSYTDAEIVQVLGVRFKEYRLSRRLTQKDVSTRTGISILTIRKFENGQAYNIQMSNFIALMRLLDRVDDLDMLLPEIPISAYEMEKIIKNKPRRIRHAK